LVDVGVYVNVGSGVFVAGPGVGVIVAVGPFAICAIIVSAAWVKSMFGISVGVVGGGGLITSHPDANNATNTKKTIKTAKRGIFFIFPSPSFYKQDLQINPNIS
jgi:hypothetical protein